MINSTKVAKRYTKALLDFAIEKKQEEELFQEVSSLVEVIHENPELRALLRSPIVKAEVKKNILQEIFSQRSSIMNIFFNILFENKRVSDIYPIGREFIEQYNHYRQKITIYLTTAVEVSQHIKDQFIAKAKQLSRKSNVILESKIDKEIIGGFILRVDDLQYNASISSKLSTIQENFKENVC